MDHNTEEMFRLMDTITKRQAEEDARRAAAKAQPPIRPKPAAAAPVPKKEKRVPSAPWLLPRANLTPEQLRTVELPADGHRLVTGLPGSGKTQVLVHRAEYLRRLLDAGPDEFRIFIFTNVLRDYIRSGMEMLDLSPESACTFDAWCCDYHLKNISPRLPPAGLSRPDFRRIRNAVLDDLRRNESRRGALDFALVDEGQDLTQECYSILRLAAGHVTVFADHLQQIYSEGADRDRILQNLGLPEHHASLLGAHRNSPEVARLASCFITEAPARAGYLAQTRNNVSERERPLFYVAGSPDDEADRLAQVVRQRMMMNQRVGILVSHGRRLEEVVKALSRRGVEVEKAVAPPVGERGSGKIWVRFDSMAPKAATYYCAKGLTFDCVLMPDLTTAAFRWLTSSIRRRVLFMGITRATRWVYLSTTRANALEELDVLRSAEEEHCLAVQRQGEAPIPPPPASGDGDFSAL